jgi:hypothetical protein
MASSRALLRDHWRDDADVIGRPELPRFRRFAWPPPANIETSRQARSDLGVDSQFVGRRARPRAARIAVAACVGTESMPPGVLEQHDDALGGVVRGKPCKPAGFPVGVVADEFDGDDPRRGRSVELSDGCGSPPLCLEALRPAGLGKCDAWGVCGAAAPSVATALSGHNESRSNGC